MPRQRKMTDAQFEQDANLIIGDLKQLAQIIETKKVEKNEHRQLMKAKYILRNQNIC